jgi:hypothetical protein
MSTLRTVVSIAALVAGHPLSAQTTPVPPPWDSVGRLLGANASLGGEVYRYNFPRTDLVVRIGDITVAPALALGSWAGFAVLGSDTVVMGDLVLTVTELPLVLSTLATAGIPVTAVHNHLVGEEPRIVYVHYMGKGSAISLAMRLGSALARTATPLPVRPAIPLPVTIDTSALFAALGNRGKANGTVAQLSFKLLTEPVTMDGQTIPPALGLMSPVNVQAVSSSRAVATGDFAVTGERVNPILAALAHAGITATAVHSHMIGESPSVYFIHFWADGSPVGVAHGLREALDAAR